MGEILIFSFMFTEDLNQPQCEAVMYNEGPSLIIAEPVQEKRVY